MLILGIMLNVNLTSCSKEDIVPEGGQVEHPNGIPSDIPNNIIYYITSDNIIVRFQNENVFGGAKIVSNTYSSTKGYGTIEFASEVTAIEREAFKNKTTLTYIVWPNSVTSIGYHAFYNCSGLTSVTIGNCVTSIGKWAFDGCSGLTSVHISDIVAWCNIEFDGSYSNPLFYAQHLYLNGDEVKDLVIPNSVTSIGGYAFRGCSGLTSVTIPNSVTSIGGSAFSGCSGLTSVTIPNSVTSIGERAFYECYGLTSVTIGNSVESIRGSAFYECSKLRDVYCYAENVPTAYSYIYDVFAYAFDNSSIANATLHVPAASVDSYKATAPWSGFGKIVALTK